MTQSQKCPKMTLAKLYKENIQLYVAIDENFGRLFRRILSIVSYG